MSVLAATAAAFTVGSDIAAGELQAPFTVSVAVVGGSGTSSDVECSLASRATSILVDCGNVTVIPVSAAVVRAAPAPKGADRGMASARQATGSDGAAAREQILPTAPPAEGMSRDHNEAGFGDNAFQQGIADGEVRVAPATRISDYSSRTIVVGNFEYTEMTVSW